jgi:hypothetical protein
MQFSPTSYHFNSLCTKYSPQHPVPKHPQSMLQAKNILNYIKSTYVKKMCWIVSELLKLKVFWGLQFVQKWKHPSTMQISISVSMSRFTNYEFMIIEACIKTSLQAGSSV